MDVEDLDRLDQLGPEHQEAIRILRRKFETGMTWPELEADQGIPAHRMRWLVRRLRLALQETPATWDESAKLLTRQERQTAELMAQGLSDAQICDRFGCSLRTVHGHAAAVRSKLRVRRNGLMRLYYSDGSPLR